MKPKLSKLYDIPTADLRRELVSRGGGWLTDDLAMAAVVLWGSGMFATSEIAAVLAVREDAVDRTLHMARDTARHQRQSAQREAAE